MTPTTGGRSRADTVLNKSGPSKDPKSTPAAPISLALDDLCAAPTATTSDEGLAVNVSVATSPVPTISFVFPAATGTMTCNVKVQVLLNGILRVTRSGSSTFYMDEDAGAASYGLADALEACGDVGVWIEWLRRRSST
ncbi:hypothetical protein LTR53_002815 [Teratosphaeriaceae sp. CCFEE 6253]|nr:hypothetical protein LTR53_002815 [Teratosphaeriaceae sp. CCFEE 6253]